MKLILFAIGVVILAGAFFALSSQVEGWGARRKFPDKDLDGAPDEPNGPAKDL